MTDRSNPYVRSAPVGYRLLRQLDDGTIQAEPTEAEKALKIVDPLGWHFPSAEAKARFCAFFDISGLDAGNEDQVHHFCGMYREYLFPKLEGVSNDQREMLKRMGRDDQTLLARAIQLNPSLIPDLVRCGAEVNQPCTGINVVGGRMTPLFLAARYNHPESIPALVQAGANLDEVREDTGQTPLLCAAKIPQMDAAYALVKNGAKVDCTDGRGASALYYAIRWNDRDLMSILIEKGARFDVNCCNMLQHVPETLRFLKEKYPALIDRAVDRGDLAAIPMLVALGLDINARGREGYTALERAVEKGDQTLVKGLLSLGADINAVTKELDYQRTALMIAVLKPDRSMITLLLDNGAKLELLSEFHRAIYRGLPRNKEYWDS